MIEAESQCPPYMARTPDSVTAAVSLHMIDWATLRLVAGSMGWSEISEDVGILEPLFHHSYD